MTYIKTCSIKALLTFQFKVQKSIPDLFSQHWQLSAQQSRWLGKEIVLKSQIICIDSVEIEEIWKYCTRWCVCSGSDSLHNQQTR